MPIPLEAIELIELIEARGSFAAAAAVLNKAPSAITYQLRQFEERLSVLIYDRTGHKAKLTPAGQLLLREGQRLLRQSHELAQTIKALDSGWEQELCIVLDDIFDFEQLLPLMSEFEQLKTPCRLRVVREVLSGTWEALFSHRAQLLLGCTMEHQVASIAGVNLRLLGSVDWVFAVSPQHPLAKHRKPLSQTDVLGHTAIAVADTSRQVKPQNIGLLPNQAVLTVPSLQAKLAAQLAGLGCGWLPTGLAQPYLNEGLLLAKATEDQARVTTLCAAWHKGHMGNALSWWVKQLHRFSSQKLKANNNPSCI